MEIERKFLVDRVPAELDGAAGTSIAQGYLAIDEEAEVRLREAGDRLTLTVKNGHGESRNETEVAIDRSVFDELWPETEGRRVEKTRRKIPIDGGLTAELDVYIGDLEGVSVVEVEFESASAASQFKTPAWFGRELTGDRAWANQTLALEGRPEKQLEFRLRAGEDPGTGIPRVIAARAAQAAAAVRLAGTSADSAVPVHEARKSLKKTRSALRLLRGVIPDAERVRVNEICRDAAGRLSGARDAEVKSGTLEKVVEGQEGLEGVDAWRRLLAGEAQGHREDLTTERLSQVEASINQVAAQFRERELGPCSEQVAGNAGRGYRRGRKSRKLATKNGAADDFHAWRKRAKDLRYQLEILEPVLSPDFTAIRRDAEELADLLGDLHDFDVLSEDLSDRGLDPSHESVLADHIAKARKAQVKRCLERGSETYDLKPGRFTNRLAEELSGGA